MELFWLISLPIGAVVGIILGVAGAGYVIIYVPLHLAETAAHAHQWSGMIAYLIALLFAKVGIVLGGFLGAVLGCVPSLVGLWRLDKKSEQDEE